MLSPLARCVFHPSDNPQLNYLFEDNMKIEPEWYCPILPMVLVNGSDGIGTGYSTTIPNYNPREIIANIKRMMAGQEPIDMVRGRQRRVCGNDRQCLLHFKIEICTVPLVKNFK